MEEVIECEIGNINIQHPTSKRREIGQTPGK